MTNNRLTTYRLQLHKLLMYPFLLFVISYLSLIMVTPASAQSSIEEIKEGTLKVEQSQDELAKIKDDESISPENKLELEIHTRKKIINDALALAFKEVDSITNKLKNLPTFAEDSREYELKREYITELENFKKYYESSAKRIENPEITLEEIKATAKSIIEYRESTYNPAIQKMVNFSLFFYTKDAINTAKTRLDKIKSDIEKLEKSNVLELDSFKESIDKIEVLIEEAREMNNKAGIEILALPIEEPIVIKEVDTISVTETTEIKEEVEEPTNQKQEEVVDAVVDIEKTDNTDQLVEGLKEVEDIKEIETIEDVEEETPNTLIVKSLNNIKSVYETFLEISIDIRKQIKL